MNSMSKGYYNDDCECVSCKKEKKCKLCPTIIKCSCPGSVTIPAGAVPTGTRIGSLNLNTSCLCDPCAKIEFASNVTISGTSTAATTLVFQVFKLCSNQTNPIPVGPSWTFNTPAGAVATTTFSFFVCDCDSCFNDCCNYFVSITGTVGTSGTIVVNNATLGAIATCGTGSCC